MSIGRVFVWKWKKLILFIYFDYDPQITQPNMTFGRDILRVGVPKTNFMDLWLYLRW